MATKIRYAFRDLFVGLSADEILNDETRRQILVEGAQKALSDAQEQNRRAIGFVPPHKTYVDQRPSESIQSVKPDGQIMYEFELLVGVIQWIDQALRDASPIGKDDDPRPGHPGHYQRSHVLIADNHKIDPDGPIPEADYYALVSTVPYARKIELPRAISKSQAPRGVYQVVAEAAQAKFGNMASIKYSGESVLFGDISEWADMTDLQSKSPSRNRPGERRTNWLTRNPSILITYRR